MADEIKKVKIKELPQTTSINDDDIFVESDSLETYKVTADDIAKYVSTNENMLYYQSGYRMDMRRVIDIVATTQQHVDQGISTTLFVTDDKTTRDIARYYIYAYKKGLKSLYYTRTKMTREDNECLMCSV